MITRTFFIAIFCAAGLTFLSGPGMANDHIAYGSAAGAHAGYGDAQARPDFNWPSEFMLFSDTPQAAPGEEAEKNPDDISSSELLHAYDAAPKAYTDTAAEAEDDAEEPGTRPQGSGPGGPDNGILDSLTVVKSDLGEPVERNIRLFSDKMKNRFTMWLSRSGRYVDAMKQIFRENSLPEDLVYLALIESGFNPKAYSWAKASGPWQFISSTGKKYGLKINWWVDERRDPVKSTRAAAAYLKDLYNMFGTWSLAMAAYNAGEGRVSRAVQKHGTLDYWEIRNTRSLAKETKEYVPRYLAAKAIAMNPASYGIEDIVYEEPVPYDVVELDSPMGLDAAAKCCGTETSVIKDLNPELRRWCTPPNTPGYQLRIPRGTAGMFAANLAKLPESEKAGFGEYVVRRGDSLGRIASKFNVPVSELARINNIRRVSMISVGQRLMIPGAGTSSAYAPSGYASYDDDDSTSARTYRVRRGDTLSTIARRHGMSTTRLASINGLSTRSIIRVGQRLKLSGAVKASYRPASSGTGAYRVRRGDTLYSIARRYGLSVDELAALNGLTRRSIIKVGQRLHVRGGDRAGNNGTRVGT